MEEYGEEAMRPDGDVGPCGSNLVTNWISCNTDRTMLVACLEDKCVGCVCVKVGSDIQKAEPNSTVASIWRLSVDEAVRRRGYGKALMDAAEEWARKQGCTQMCLETANPTAGKFYTETMGYQVHRYPVEPFSISLLIFSYSGVIKKYTKSLVATDRGDS